MMKKKRIFLATLVDDHVKEELSFLQQELQNYFPEIIRWSKKDDFHITLFFFGLMEEDDAKKLGELIEKVKVPFCDIEIEKIQYLPKDLKKAKVICATISSKGLLKWRGEIKDMLVKNFKIISDVEFFPHITLGRIKSWKSKDFTIEQIPELQESVNLSFRAGSYALYESILKKEGPVYKKIIQLDAEK